MIASPRRVAAAVVGALTVGVLAGCGTSVPSAATQAPIPVESAWYPGLLAAGHPGQGLGPDVPASSSPSPSSSATPTPSDSTLDDAVQQRLAEVGLQSTDVTGLTATLATDGTSLSQSSMPYCEKTYPAEKTREARRRVELLTAAGKRTGLSSEAVVFLTPADATTALSQLAAGAAACATTRTLTTNGRTYTVVQHPSTDVPVTGLVAAKQRLLLSTIVTDSTDPKAVTTYRIQRIWQQRGRVVVGLFVESAGSDFTTAELSAVGRLASSVATRLGQLDSTLTGAS